MSHTFITIDQVSRVLRAPVKEFLEKCDYPFKLAGQDACRVVEPEGTVYTYVTFVDPNNLDGCHAGGLRDVWIGNRNTRRKAFRIVSRDLQTDKHRWDSERRCSKETGKIDRVVKIMLALIKPRTPQQIADEHDALTTREINNWRRECYSGYQEFDNIPVEELVEELAYLHSTGVKFKSEKFTKLMEEQLPVYQEFKARRRAAIDQYFVNIVEGRGIDVVLNNSNHVHYDNFEDMPEKLKEGVSLLKMLPNTGDGLPTVGIRANAHAFWVFDGMQ